MPGIAVSTPGVEGEQLSCTYPLTYWVEHPERYPNRVWIGQQVLGEQDIQEALNYTGPDVPSKLTGELLGSFLNTLAGADQSVIESIVFDAYSWLVAHPVGAPINGADWEAARTYLVALEEFNKGNLGVSACPGFVIPTLPDQPTNTPWNTFTPTPTPTPTLTPTTTPTGTSVPSITPRPFLTRTPTRTPFGQPPPTATITSTSTRPVIPPTATATQPRLPTATSTNPPPPPPTATATVPNPPTPTEPPVITNTPIPSPTDTPSSPPTPTPPP